MPISSRKIILDKNPPIGILDICKINRTLLVLCKNIPMCYSYDRIDIYSKEERWVTN